MGMAWGLPNEKTDFSRDYILGEGLSCGAPYCTKSVLMLSLIEQKITSFDAYIRTLLKNPWCPYFYVENIAQPSRFSMRRNYCCPNAISASWSCFHDFTNSGIKPGVANMRAAFELSSYGISCQGILWTLRWWKYSRRALMHGGSPCSLKLPSNPSPDFLYRTCSTLLYHNLSNNFRNNLGRL